MGVLIGERIKCIDIVSFLATLEKVASLESAY